MASCLAAQARGVAVPQGVTPGSGQPITFPSTWLSASLCCRRGRGGACLPTRRLALGLDHHARGLCHVVHSQDVDSQPFTMQDVQPMQDVQFQPRSPMQLLAALEMHVSSSGMEIFASLRDSLCWASEKQREREGFREREREATERERLQREEALQFLQQLRAKDHIALLQLKGLNDTRGLFEKLQEDLAAMAEVDKRIKGSALWEVILKKNKALRDCIDRCTKIPATDHVRQAAQCSAIYNVFSQHVYSGKELAELQAANGVITFQRGPMSPEQVQIFLCMGEAAYANIAEDPSTRPC